MQTATGTGADSPGASQRATTTLSLADRAAMLRAPRHQAQPSSRDAPSMVAAQGLPVLCSPVRMRLRDAPTIADRLLGFLCKHTTQCCAATPAGHRWASRAYLLGHHVPEQLETKICDLSRRGRRAGRSRHPPRVKRQRHDRVLATGAAGAAGRARGAVPGPRRHASHQVRCGCAACITDPMSGAAAPRFAGTQRAQSAAPHGQR